jgi:hypothetical protein
VQCNNQLHSADAVTPQCNTTCLHVSDNAYIYCCIGSASMCSADSRVHTAIYEQHRCLSVRYKPKWCCPASASGRHMAFAPFQSPYLRMSEVFDWILVVWELWITNWHNVCNALADGPQLPRPHLQSQNLEQ